MKKSDNSIVKKVFRQNITANILNNLTWAIGALVDTAIIGRFLGVDAMAAYSLVWPMTLIYALVGGVLSGGSRNLYTLFASKGEIKKANQIFSIATILSGGLSLVLVVLTFVFMTPLAKFLGASGENIILLPLVSQYLFGFVIGLPFDNTAKILSSYMGIDYDQGRVFIATAAMTAIKIVGDLVVVRFLNGGMFLLGCVTTIGNVVYCFVLATHFLNKKRILSFEPVGISEIFNKGKEMVASGMSTGISRISTAISGIIINDILSTLGGGSNYIAAYGVHKSMGNLIGVIYLGIAETVWLLSSIYFGEEDQRALDELQRTAIRTGLAITTTIMVVILLFPNAFARIYINVNDTQALALATQSIRVFALSIPLFLIVYIFDDYLMGTGKRTAADIYSFLLGFGVVVPTVWIMSKIMGPSGVWFATPVYLLIMLFLTFAFINRWNNGETFDIKRLLLSSGFGPANGAELAYSADSILEIEGISRLVGLFCKENGIDDKKANIIAICVEELGTNIIEHGFIDGKRHSIDIRIIAKDNELILRIRDDCRPFNIVERYKMISMQDNNPEKNIGIRLVMNMCSDVKYVSTMGTNNLIIRI